MNKIIVPTGYMGSGSSAITDILNGFENYSAPNDSFEFVFLHCPDGLFDLEDKLLMGNNAIRSDEAIYRFENQMKSLYNKKNFWVGSYRKFVSDRFLDYVDEFIKSIITCSFNDVYWYFQEEPISSFMQIRLYLYRLIDTITFGNIKSNKPLRYKILREAFPTEDEFYDSSKVFLGKLFNDLGIEENNIILDQLLLPHNLYRLEHYFNDNIRVIVVDRDPRDVYILNKYVWKKKNSVVPYPLEANLFCEYYKRMRNIEHIINDERIIRLHFEDLVYKYYDSIDTLKSFLKDEIIKKSNGNIYFDPDASIRNTQLFRDPSICCNEVIGEIKTIEKSLSNYMYDFPDIHIVRNGLKDLF